MCEISIAALLPGGATKLYEEEQRRCHPYRRIGPEDVPELKEFGYTSGALGPFLIGLFGSSQVGQERKDACNELCFKLAERMASH